MGTYQCPHCEEFHHVLETLNIECLIALIPYAQEVLEAFEEEQKKDHNEKFLF